MSTWIRVAFLVLAGLLFTAEAYAQSCTNSTQCDDHIFCNGPESCLKPPGAKKGTCGHLQPPCEPQFCNEANHTCNTCQRDADCSDGSFCNGIERCAPGTPGQDVNGCIPPPGPPCSAGQTCDEANDRCVFACVDADGDGVDSVSCGGTDCDDSDANRFPGNIEVCDTADHDEDCDPETFGVRDADRDGFSDSKCCNVTVGGARRCGSDCDDLNEAIHPGAMICSTTNRSEVLICEASGGYQPTPCSSGRVCEVLENGTGICLPTS